MTQLWENQCLLPRIFLKFYLCWIEFLWQVIFFHRSVSIKLQWRVFHFSTFTDILMNIVGVFLWIAVGATALHYWNGYLQENWYTVVDSERQVSESNIFQICYFLRFWRLLKCNVLLFVFMEMPLFRWNQWTIFKISIWRVLNNSTNKPNEWTKKHFSSTVELSRFASGVLFIYRSYRKKHFRQASKDQVGLHRLFQRLLKLPFPLFFHMCGEKMIHRFVNCYKS